MNIIRQAGLALVISAVAGPALANTAGQINLNKASREELVSGITGLTPAQADAIIAHRKKEGVIVNLHELHYLGIGREIIEPNYGKLSVGNVSNADKKKS